MELPFENAEPVEFLSKDVVNESSSRQIFVAQVDVNGGETFSRAFFNKLLSPLLSHSDCTLAQMTENINKSYSALKNTRVFRDIAVSVNSDFCSILPHSPTVYGSEQPFPAKILFDLTPCNLSVVEGLINVNSQDHLNLNLDYLNRNFNGNAESVNFGVDYNPYKPHDRLLTHATIASAMRNPSSVLLLNLHHGQRNNQMWQSASEAATGGSIGLQHSFHRGLNAYAGFSILKRSLHDVDDNATKQVKNSMSDVLQTSLVGKAVFLNVDATPTSLPSRNGFHASLESLVSSAQENNSSENHTFVRGSLSTESWCSLLSNTLTAKAAASAGIIYLPLNSQTHVSEKFYLGGMHSFRGLEKNALNVDGGNFFLKFGCTLYGCFPSFILKSPKLRSPHPLRWYIDGTVGSLGHNSAARRTDAASVGVGIKYFYEWANFEAGYYVAQRLNDSSTAGIKNGLVFAVSIGGTNRDQQQ